MGDLHETKAEHARQFEPNMIKFKLIIYYLIIVHIVYIKNLLFSFKIQTTR